MKFEFLGNTHATVTVWLGALLITAVNSEDIEIVAGWITLRRPTRTAKDDTVPAPPLFVHLGYLHAPTVRLSASVPSANVLRTCPSLSFCHFIAPTVFAFFAAPHFPSHLPNSHPSLLNSGTALLGYWNLHSTYSQSRWILVESLEWREFCKFYQTQISGRNSEA